MNDLPVRTPATAEQDLQVFDCPLQGVRLIEASAGTGKTWNLCALHLRLLLERGLEVRQILVVTFTNAATAELKTRIRQRLAETLAHLQGRSAPTGDPFVPTLLATLRRRGLDDARMASRLQAALAGFDDAAISTIHGFCQRALSDTPFAGQMPLSTELVTDDSPWIDQAAGDFWRRHVAGTALPPLLAAELMRRKDSPGSLAALLRRHLGKPTARPLWPAGLDEAETFRPDELQAAHDAARQIWQQRRDAILQRLEAALPQMRANIYHADTLQEAADGWDLLLRDDDALGALALAPKKLEWLTTDKLHASKKKAGEPPADPFFDAAQALLDHRQTAMTSAARARLRLLRRWLDEGARDVRAAKRRQRVVSFNDMLFNLHDRLTTGQAPWLAAALRQRFPAALIDEFQDTDPLQFEIFRAIYGVEAPTLFLIGDPKQAIYSFRNADLPTYLKARRQADAAYTLASNQRSSKALIEALNALFSSNPRAFMLDGLAYRHVGVGDRPRGTFVDTTEPRAALQVWTLPTDAAGRPAWTRREAQAAVPTACAAEIARLLVAARDGRVQLDGRTLRAGDIAVLVRSHTEGSRMRQALAELGVASVELSQASVFESPDAEELERVLAAVLEPTREGLLRAALSTRCMGLDAGALERLGESETELPRWMQRLADDRDTWLRRGAGVMLRQWMAREGVAERLLASPDGARRLTNLLHLVELLHEAAQSQPSPDALLRWLQARRRDAAGDEAAQLRLETDQNLVQIVTIHKSKGLEYPVVVCPFLWDGHLPGSPGDALDGREYHDDAGDVVVDFRSPELDAAFQPDDVKARQRLEACAEHLRLIYVALTRAVHRCVLVAGVYASRDGAQRSAKESTRSLLNWLVAGGGATPSQWLEGVPEPAVVGAAWQALAQAAGPAIAVEPLPSAAAHRLPSDDGPHPALRTPPLPRIPEGWTTGSYTALVHGATHDPAGADHDLRVTASEGLDTPDASVATDDILRFPRGAASGICLHALFETIDFTQPEGWPGAVAAALRALGPVQASPADRGTQADPAMHPAMLQRLLTDVLHTPLPVGTPRPLRLAELPRSRRLDELEFHLPTQRLDAGALNAALARWGCPMPRLGFAPLRGFLKGFIDLVFEHDGRFFVLDWKSNHLGWSAAHYRRERVELAMATEGYHLQSLLYGVALERFLQQRIPGYDTATHFGGVLYLFIRGVRPHWRDADGHPTGVFFSRPAPAVLHELSALLGEVGTANASYAGRGRQRLSAPPSPQDPER